MSVDVFIGYKDENDEPHGFYGILEKKEYGLLKSISEKFNSPGILSTDELQALSDVKDILAKAQIKLYDIGRDLSESNKQKMEKISKVLGETLESFDVYRQDAPQLDFLLSFCIIDSHYVELDEDTDNYESNNLLYVSPDFIDDDELITTIFESNVLSDASQLIVSEDMMNVISEWIDLDGRRYLIEASMTEDDEYLIEEEIEWWRDNMSWFEYIHDFDLTLMLYRALRNNVLKSMRTGKLVLSHKDWSKRIEIF